MPNQGHRRDAWGRYNKPSKFCGDWLTGGDVGGRYVDDGGGPSWFYFLFERSVCKIKS